MVTHVNASTPISPSLLARMRALAENAVERSIIEDPAWQAGAAWGKPRPGHPEGMVLAHVEEVLSNVDEVALDADDRAQLRLIALIHDTFKHRVDRTRPLSGENHHAMIARRFAEQHGLAPHLLDVIELHDEAHNAWNTGNRDDRWGRAESRAHALVKRLGPNLGLYRRFFHADSHTGNKASRSLEWFEQMLSRSGYVS